MTAKDRFKQQFAEATALAFQKIYPDKYAELGDKDVFDSSHIYDSIAKPKDPTKGRFALPVFRYASLLGSKPPDIAAKVAEEINRELTQPGNGPALALAEAAGGFVNARTDFVAAARETLDAILRHGSKYGDSNVGQKRKLLVEYSSPNIAKPFHFGHLRSTIIGHSLKRIFAKLGYDAIGINFHGDWGTQFGKMIVAWEKWADDATQKSASIKDLLKLYVQFHSEAENDTSLDDQARAAFKRLEDGDSGYSALWKLFKTISGDEFDRIYNILGVDFDLVTSESFLNDMMDSAIERLDKDGLTSVSRGALVVEMDDSQLPPCLLRRSDGATLYATRDITGLIYRWEKYRFAESLYVVNSGQSDHFKQAFNVIKKMENAEKLPESERMTGKAKHIEFGWVRFGEKAMSTRHGNIVFLEDVLKEAGALVARRIEEKNPELFKSASRFPSDLGPYPKIAEQIGVGAVIFSQLSVRRQKDINFNWDEILSFEGETGPYLQYTHARLCSLMRKYDGDITAEIDYELLNHDAEQRLIELLTDFPQSVADAARLYDPCHISGHLLKLTAAFNIVYQRKDKNGRVDKILSDNKELSAARMALVKATKIVIGEGLRLLGLTAPEEM